MLVKLKSKTVYIPEWEENKKQPEKEQIKFYLRLLNSEERAECITYKSKGDKVISSPDLVGFCKYGVTKIENLEIEIDGKKEKIESAEKLLAAEGLFELFQEVALHVFTENGIVDQQN